MFCIVEPIFLIASLISSPNDRTWDMAVCINERTFSASDSNNICYNTKVFQVIHFLVEFVSLITSITSTFLIQFRVNMFNSVHAYTRQSTCEFQCNSDTLSNVNENTVSSSSKYHIGTLLIMGIFNLKNISLCLWYMYFIVYLMLYMSAIVLTYITHQRIASAFILHTRKLYEVHWVVHTFWVFPGFFRDGYPTMFS